MQRLGKIPDEIENFKMESNHAGQNKTSSESTDLQFGCATLPCELSTDPERKATANKLPMYEDTIKKISERSDLRFPNSTSYTQLENKSSVSTSQPPIFLSSRAQRALSKIRANYQDTPVNIPLSSSRTDSFCETIHLQGTLLSKKAQRALDRIKNQHLSNTKLDLPKISSPSADRDNSPFGGSSPALTAPMASADRSRHCPIFLHMLSKSGSLVGPLFQNAPASPIPPWHSPVCFSALLLFAPVVELVPSVHGIRDFSLRAGACQCDATDRYWRR